MSLPGYDNWRLSSPPEYDTPDCCPACGVQWEGDAGQCQACGYGEPEDAPDDHDHAFDSARDDALDPACAAGKSNRG